MLPSKPRSSVSDNLNNNKTTPATPKSGKTARSGSMKNDALPSPLSKSRNSPRSVESKPKVELRSPRFSTTTPNKQAQLGEVQEDLKKAKEQLTFVEQEKVRVLEELNNTKKIADEANEKLKEALAAQRRAEESSEIEKFRADELEQANIDAAQKREEERGNELESIIEKHNLELEKIKNELEATTKAKTTSLSHAEDAMKIAEINAEKVEILNIEINRLKSLMDSKLESVVTDKEEVIKKLEFEVESLKTELERAKQAEKKLVNMEALVEKLNSDVENEKSAKDDLVKLSHELEKKSEHLEIELTETKKSEDSFLKQLEEIKVLLQDSEIETTTLREKIELLESELKSSLESEDSLTKQLEEFNASLLDAESETEVLKGKVKSLEIEIVDVKNQELESSKQANEWKEKSKLFELQLTEANKLKESTFESLSSVTKELEESNSSLQIALSNNEDLQKKIGELEIVISQLKDELVNSKNYLDVSKQDAGEMVKEIEILKSEMEIIEKEKSEALNSEESLLEEKNKLIKELEMAREEEEKAKKAMEGMASALHEISNESRETQERLFAKEAEHEDSNTEIERLRSNLKNTEKNYEGLLNESRDEIVTLKKAIEKLENDAKESQSEWEVKEVNFVNAIKGSEEELTLLKSIKEERKEMASKLREAESKASTANEAFEEVKAEALRLRERLLDRENELQSINQENIELRTRETASLKKIDELTASLDVATTKTEVNGEALNYEKENELLSNSSDTQLENIKMNEKVEEEVNLKEDNNAIKKDEDFSLEMENKRESIDDDMDLKTESESFEHDTNGPQLDAKDDVVAQKKKKHLLQKFGSLLKKKSPLK